MEHLANAEKETEFSSFIKVAGQNVVFTIQDGPINEVGVNGCQAQDMLEFVKHLFVSLDNKFPCQENKNTITHLRKALYQQDQRNKDRIERGVEGNNLA